MARLVTHLHEFIKEAKYLDSSCFSKKQKMTTSKCHYGRMVDCSRFHYPGGPKSTPLRQEVMLVFDVLGVSALVDALNNPAVNGATESCVLSPFFTEESPDGT